MVSDEKMLKLWTDDGRPTDAGETGILLAHPRAFDSGELKSVRIIIAMSPQLSYNLGRILRG